MTFRWTVVQTRRWGKFVTYYYLLGAHRNQFGRHPNAFGSHQNLFGSHWNLPS